MPLESKKHYADYIINNNGNISNAASAAENVIKDILCKNKKMGESTDAFKINKSYYSVCSIYNDNFKCKKYLQTLLSC